MSASVLGTEKGFTSRSGLLRRIIVLLETQLAELVSRVILKSWVFPFPLRFEEECESIATTHQLVSIER